LTDLPTEVNGTIAKELMVEGQTVYELNQGKYLLRVSEIQISDEQGEHKQLVSQNAAIAFVCHYTRYDLLIQVSLFSQVTLTKYKSGVRNQFNNFVRKCHETAHISMRFIPLDMETVHVSVFEDASFGTNNDGSSQWGIILALRDASGRANVIHAASHKSKRVARSALAAELFAVVDRFDMGIVMKHWFSNVLGQPLDLHILTDSRRAFHTITTIVKTRERRLMIDLQTIRESYERREISKVTWITGVSNPAEGLTKIKHNGVLDEVIRTNYIDIQQEGWVDRPVESVTRSKEKRASVENCVETPENQHSASKNSDEESRLRPISTSGVRTAKDPAVDWYNLCLGV
jgi:hypothetical protein